jgi:hypothetical protein
MREHAANTRTLPIQKMAHPGDISTVAAQRFCNQSQPGQFSQFVRPFPGIFGLYPQPLVANPASLVANPQDALARRPRPVQAPMASPLPR